MLLNLEEGTQKSEMKILLTKMASFLKDMTHPDGKISLFSDGGLNMAYSTDECLSVYENLVGEKTIQSGIISFPNAGYYGLRTRDNLILMDAAELAARNLPGHGHGDALSFEYSVKGCRVLIDPGVFEYDEGKLRSFSRSTSSHNTVTLDNKDQSEFWKSLELGEGQNYFARRKKTSDKITVTASHDGYTRLKGKPIHKRSILMTKKYIKVNDFILNGDGQKATSRYLLHPQIRVEESKNKCILIGNEFEIMVQSNHPITITDNICFLDFGKIHQTKQLIIILGSRLVVAKQFSQFVEFSHRP